VLVSYLPTARAGIVGATVFLLMLPGIFWLERAPYEKQKSPHKPATAN